MLQTQQGQGRIKTTEDQTAPQLSEIWTGAVGGGGGGKKKGGGGGKGGGGEREREKRGGGGRGGRGGGGGGGRGEGGEGGGEKQRCREKRTRQEKIELEVIHELVRVRLNKEIKLRLTGEKRESKESIGN